jgi:hypothetical protein
MSDLFKRLGLKQGSRGWEIDNGSTREQDVGSSMGSGMESGTGSGMGGSRKGSG